MNLVNRKGLADVPLGNSNSLPRQGKALNGPPHLGEWVAISIPLLAPRRASLAPTRAYRATWTPLLSKSLKGLLAAAAKHHTCSK